MGEVPLQKSAVKSHTKQKWGSAPGKYSCAEALSWDCYSNNRRKILHCSKAPLQRLERFNDVCVVKRINGVWGWFAGGFSVLAPLREEP